MNTNNNSLMGADTCLTLLRTKCKRQAKIGLKVSKEQRSKAGYSATTSVGTLFQSPASETKAEEVTLPHGKAVFKRVFLKNSGYNVGWIMDSETNNCMSCEVSFGLFTRKHHCRQCGEIVCYSCSQQRLHLPSLEEPGGSRVCTRCMEKLYQDALERRQKLNRKVYFAGVPSGSLFETSVVLERAPVHNISPKEVSSPVCIVEQKQELATSTPPKSQLQSLRVTKSVEDKLQEALLHGINTPLGKLSA
jgi:hypothetical protein